MPNNPMKPIMKLQSMLN